MTLVRKLYTTLTLVLILSISTQCTNAVAIGSIPTRATVENEFQLNSFMYRWVDLWVADNLAPGTSLDSLKSIGLQKTLLKQSDLSKRPLVTNDGSIYMRAALGQHLYTDSGAGDVLARYRGAMAIFTVKGSSAKDIAILETNRPNTGNAGEGERSPYISYNDKGLSVIWQTVNKNGLIQQIVFQDSKHFIADGKTYNVVLTYRREGKVFTNINGHDIPAISDQVEWYTHKARFQDAAKSKNYLGATSPLNAELKIKLAGILQGELTESVVEKMAAAGMIMVNRQADLPATNPYNKKVPLIEETDQDHIYPYDAETVRTIIESAGLPENRASNGFVLSNLGKPRALDMTGWTEVFTDDFREKRLASSLQDSNIETPLLFTGSWNTAITGSATMLDLKDPLDVYEHNPANKTQRISLKLHNNRWYGGTLSTIDRSGVGRSWGGERRIQTRFRLPKRRWVEGDRPGNELASALFHAMGWGYNENHMFLRHLPRYEFDPNEPHGANPYYLNGGSMHAHDSAMDSYGYTYPTDGLSKKIIGKTLTANATGVSGGINFWDGKFHTFETVITKDVTYLNMTYYKGRNNYWIELARFPTPPWLLEKQYIVHNVSLQSHGKKPNQINVPNTHEYMDLSFFKVYKRTTDKNAVPEPFIKRPTLSSYWLTAGKKVTINANAPGVKDIKYEVMDETGYPYFYSRSNTFTVPVSARGKRLQVRCHLVGYKGKPEAFTAFSRTVR